MASHFLILQCGRALSPTSLVRGSEQVGLFVPHILYVFKLCGLQIVDFVCPLSPTKQFISKARQDHVKTSLALQTISQILDTFV